jgi:hypothetical protein
LNKQTKTQNRQLDYITLFLESRQARGIKRRIYMNKLKFLNIWAKDRLASPPTSTMDAVTLYLLFLYKYLC